MYPIGSDVPQEKVNVFPRILRIPSIYENIAIFWDDGYISCFYNIRKENKNGFSNALFYKKTPIF